MSLKNPVTRPGIDPGTVRIVEQRLNHYATPSPTPSLRMYINLKYIVVIFIFNLGFVWILCGAGLHSRTSSPTFTSVSPNALLASKDKVLCVVKLCENVIVCLVVYIYIYNDTNKILPTPNATTCPLWTSWPPLSVVAEV
jgi:hypothetical protein